MSSIIKVNEIQPASGSTVTITGLPTIAVTGGGTGATSAASARTNLGAAASGANTDITSLSSPSLGSATAITQSANDNSTKVATTAYADAIGALITSVPAGVVMPYAGSAAPTGYLLCYGQAVNRTTYSALFTAISTTYGVGDGSTTFNVPDLRGRSPFGKDNMGGSAASRVTNAISGVDGATLGATGGSESITAHTHDAGTLATSSDGAHTHTGGASTAATDGQTGGAYAVYASANTGSNGAHTHSVTGSTASTGAGASQNMPPAIVLNYIIKT